VINWLEKYIKWCYTHIIIIHYYLSTWYSKLKQQ